MNAGTANKLVAAFALGGVVIGLWTGNGAAGKYRKVWGVILLSIGGAALADFAPGLVGPYFGLIILAYGVGHVSSISNVVAGIKTNAGVKQ